MSIHLETTFCIKDFRLYPARTVCCLANLHCLNQSDMVNVNHTKLMTNSGLLLATTWWGF